MKFISHKADYAIAESELLSNPICAELCGSHREGSNKQLLVETAFGDASSPQVAFVVTNQGAETYRGLDLREAVNAYNAAP